MPKQTSYFTRKSNFCFYLSFAKCEDNSLSSDLLIFLIWRLDLEHKAVGKGKKNIAILLPYMKYLSFLIEGFSSL